MGKLHLDICSIFRKLYKKICCAKIKCVAIFDYVYLAKRLHSQNALKYSIGHK